VTEVPDEYVPEEVYDLTRRHLAEKQLIDLTLATVAINAWNRIAISCRSVPGTMSARRREDKTSEQLLVLMLDGDDGATSMNQVERLAEILVRDSYEDLSEEAIRELKMRNLVLALRHMGASLRL
jgi:hypothetical protein